MKILKTICFVCLLLNMPFLVVDAETVKLKNGITFTGDLTEKTEKYIKVKRYGTETPYFNNEIETIDDKNFADWLKASKKTKEKNAGESARGAAEDATKVYIRLAKACFKKNDYKQAVVNIEKAVSLWPDNLEYKVALGRAYFLTDNFARSEDILKRVISLDANNSNAYFLMGKINMKKNDLVVAVEYLEKAQRLDSKTAEIPYLLGFVYHRSEKYKDAVVSWEKAIKMGWFNFQAQYPLGVAYFKTGEYSKARQYLGKALTFNAVDKKIVYEVLGRIYLKENNKEQAQVFFEKAAELGSQSARVLLQSLSGDRAAVEGAAVTSGESRSRTVP